MRGSEDSRKARKRFGRMVRVISTLCFFLPRASTITSPVGGSEGGAGREEEEGAGEEGTGEEGRDGGGAGHGEGETSGGESGEVIIGTFEGGGGGRSQSRGGARRGRGLWETRRNDEHIEPLNAQIYELTLVLCRIPLHAWLYFYKMNILR